MKFSNPLFIGTLIKRYKRFLADIILENGQKITAYCSNTGAMTGINKPGLKVWVSKVSPKGKSKLNYHWEIVEESSGVLVGVNTQYPNKLIEEAWYEGKLKPLNFYTNIEREVKYGKNSRIDFLLTDKSGTFPPCYVEVKNIHLCRKKGIAEFPDSVTFRGAKHMMELQNQLYKSSISYIVYVVQRLDCVQFKISGDIDCNYIKLAYEAYSRGVIPLAYACVVSKDEIKISHPIKILDTFND